MLTNMIILGLATVLALIYLTIDAVTHRRSYEEFCNNIAIVILVDGMFILIWLAGYLAARFL